MQGDFPVFDYDELYNSERETRRRETEAANHRAQVEAFMRAGQRRRQRVDDLIAPLTGHADAPNHSRIVDLDAPVSSDSRIAKLETEIAELKARIAALEHPQV